MQFIAEDAYYKRYFDAFYILFKTGLCISEIRGLTMKDIDFRKKVIRVNHQLRRTSDMKYICESKQIIYNKKYTKEKSND
nr:tyrosine-type recombinase/integrase [uncultured Blautia sp.]